MVHLFMLSWNSFLPYFPSHWLFPHITIVKTMDSSERGINPVAMLSSIFRKDNGLARDQIRDPSSLFLYATNPGTEVCDISKVKAIRADYSNVSIVICLCKDIKHGMKRRRCW